MSISEWAALAAHCSLDAIDLSILFVPDRSLAAARAIRREVQDSGLRVAMLTTYSDFTHPAPAQRAVELERAVESVALAAELGAVMIRVTAGQAHPETSRQAGREWAIEGLTQLAAQTRSSGVTLLYENHAKPGAWNYTDFSQPPDLFLEIARAIIPHGFKINFDTANATAFATDPLALLTEVQREVFSIHAADTAVRGELRPVLLGTGVAPFDAFFHPLAERGWDNWICIEEASFSGEAGVAKAAAFVRRTWSEAVYAANSAL